VQCASAFLRNGIQYATLLLDGLDVWGNEHGFRSVEEFRGRLAVPWNVDPQEYTREGYVAALQTASLSYLHR
jgi:dihydroorotate dehydrogenase (fumarate)